MIRILVRTENGATCIWLQDDTFYRKLISLQEDGCDGPTLVRKLLPNDWSSPPQRIEITGVLENGSIINESIPCQESKNQLSDA